MTAKEACISIREAILLRQDLRWRDGVNRGWVGNPYLGFCYIATEVLCHLIPEAKPYCSLDRRHFWAMIDGEVFDPTWDQFESTYTYQGRKTRFPSKMTKRSCELLEVVESLTRS